MPAMKIQEEQSLLEGESLKEIHGNVSCVTSTTRLLTLQGVRAKKNKGNRYIIIIIMYCNATSYFPYHCKV